MKIEKDFKNKKILLLQADITDLETDAIVNAANDHLWMGSGVAGAIKAKGGNEIEKKAMSKGPTKIGEAIVTTAGKLKAKYVIHAVVMGQNLQTSENYIRDATLNSLKIAEELKLNSITFPALGTGVGGFPVDRCADAMISTVAGFFRDNKSLKEVHFVLLKKEDYDVFTLVLEKIWSDCQWSLEMIETNQQAFSLLYKKDFESYYELLNESEEVLVQTMNVSNGFYFLNKDDSFNEAFCLLSSYIIEDAEAVKKLMSKGIFTSSSILLRHIYSCYLKIIYLRNFPEDIVEWLEESKKDILSTKRVMNSKFEEINMKNKLEKKGEKIDYKLFTGLSKSIHGSPNWMYQFQDLNIFAMPVKRSVSILVCRSFISTFSELLYMTVGEFLKKYQSEIKSNYDVAKLKFRYDEILKKSLIFIDELKKEIKIEFD